MKIRVSLVSCLLISIVSLSGCAAIQQDMIAQTCNTDAAYATGVNNAKNGFDMQNDFAAICPNNTAAINSAYRDGYQFGLSAINEGTNINIYTKHRHYLAQ